MEWDVVMHRTAEQEETDMVVNVMKFIEKKIELIKKSIKEKAEAIQYKTKMIIEHTDDMEENCTMADEIKDISKELIELHETWKDLVDSMEHIENPMDDDDLQTHLYYIKKEYGGSKE